MESSQRSQAAATRTTPLSGSRPADDQMQAKDHGFQIQRIGPDLRRQAVARLICSPRAGDVKRATGQFIAAAPAHGIDMDLFWASIHRPTGRIGHVCLVVPAPGRTASVFVSVTDEPASGDAAEQIDERAAVIDAACRSIAQMMPERVHLAQALPEPEEVSAVAAFERGGFSRIGRLSYMLLSDAGRVECAGSGPPEGIVVRNVRGVDAGGSDRRFLIEALDRSYEQTLDCPELCGMRRTEDVLESHLHSGQFDPSLWWLVFQDGRAEGCVLFGLYQEQASAELVYIGLSPVLRGRGLGEWLLRMALSRVSRLVGPTGTVTCAVDERNAPAAALYRRLGFDQIAQRVALVRPMPGA